MGCMYKGYAPSVTTLGASDIYIQMPPLPEERMRDIMETAAHLMMLFIRTGTATKHTLRLRAQGRRSINFHQTILNLNIFSVMLMDI